MSSMQQSQQSPKQLQIEPLHEAGVDGSIVDGIVEGDEDVLGALASLEGAEELLAIGEGPWHENGHYASLRDHPGDSDTALPEVTQRIETGHGKVYVVIEVDSQGRPFKIQAFTGSSGGFTNSFVEALEEVISIALQSGVNPRYIISGLENIRGPKVAWDNGEEIPSVASAIGIALRRYMNDTMGEGRSTKFDGSECPECGSPDVYVTEGVKHCETCGWDDETETPGEPSGVP